MIELKNAARLTEELSRARYKEIRLVLTSTGVSVDGTLFRADGVVMQRYRADQPWDEVAGGGAALETMIRDMDRRLVGDWRNEEPAHEP